MKIRKLIVGPVRTNCYIAYDEESREAFLVDPGADEARILAFIRENGLTLTHILLTHSHFDHVMALAAVQKETGAAVCVHALESENIEKGLHPELRAMGLPAWAIEPVPVSSALADGEKLSLLGREFTVLHTPGHTQGSVCYDDGETLFSGDTLFALSCGRTDLPGGNTAVILESLTRLAALEGGRKVLPGHEEETTLELERSRNPYMRGAREDP